MTHLDKAFQAFKDNPTAQNAWALQQAMVVHAQSAPADLQQPTTNKRKPATLKTKRGGIWDARLKEVLELFAAFDWEVVPYKSNKYIESWKVTAASLDQAILYLSTNGFSLGGKKPDETLTGCFEGYDEQDRFDDFLVCNGIEIDD